MDWWTTAFLVLVAFGLAITAVYAITEYKKGFSQPTPIPASFANCSWISGDFESTRIFLNCSNSVLACAKASPPLDYECFVVNDSLRQKQGSVDS